MLPYTCKKNKNIRDKKYKCMQNYKDTKKQCKTTKKYESRNIQKNYAKIQNGT